MKNQDPEAVQTVFSIIQSYGWFMVIAAVGLYYIGSKLGRKLSERIEANSRSSTDVNELEQIRRARAAKLQQEYDEKARIEFLKKQERDKEREEKKRLEKIEQWNNLQSGSSYFGRRLGSRAEEETEVPENLPKPKKSDSNSRLRNNEWNPLTGSSGGSASFRPSRRGPASGG